jgi:hypothetical protein
MAIFIALVVGEMGRKVKFRKRQGRKSMVEGKFSKEKGNFTD